MKQERYCIYNKTQQNFLSQGMTAVDTTTEPFKALISDLTNHAATGLWLRPFRGIPEARTLPRFDLVYLDERQRVIKGAESFSAKEFAPFSGRVASAIVLPPQTIATAHVRAGDQLKIAPRNDQEMEVLLAKSDDKVDSAVQPAKTVKAVQNLDEAEKPATLFGYPPLAVEEKHSALGRFLHWLLPEEEKSSDRRRSERWFSPGLIAYYWNGASPESYALKDISLNGFYLITDERWRADTIIQMRLQRADLTQAQDDSVAVTARVVRWGVDGVGLNTIFAEAAGEHAARLNGAGTAAQDWLAFIRRVGDARKSAPVEAQLC